MFSARFAGAFRPGCWRLGQLVSNRADRATFHFLEGGTQSAEKQNTLDDAISLGGNFSMWVQI